jgi:hypothetical protein
MMWNGKPGNGRHFSRGGAYGMLPELRISAKPS